MSNIPSQVGISAKTSEKLTTLTSAVGFTPATLIITEGPKRHTAREAYISFEVADVRWTIDGTTPVVTATTNGVGHLAPMNSDITLIGYEAILNFRAINAVGANGSFIRATFFF